MVEAIQKEDRQRKLIRLVQLPSSLTKRSRKRLHERVAGGDTAFQEGKSCERSLLFADQSCPQLAQVFHTAIDRRIDPNLEGVGRRLVEAR
jgi:hypothetical protein